MLSESEYPEKPPPNTVLYVTGIFHICLELGRQWQCVRLLDYRGMPSIRIENAELITFDLVVEQFDSHGLHT